VHTDNVEKCFVIRLSPSVYVDAKTSLPRILNQKLTAEEKVKALTKGVMLCQGEARKVGMDFVENYFVINQKTPSTLLVNANSDLARPFFVNVRGVRDFNGMMSFLHAVYTTPDSAGAEYQSRQFNEVKLAETFMQGVCTYPGQYQNDK
jgi:hypothetical protein